ncbi:MAG TPA: DUF4252 domain-containing protein [Draconibacterium sp.]|nr:DUF4252 domain-containing protein [Draconibacterium sp.]
MKKLIILVLFIGVTMTAQTQDSQAYFEQLTEKYSEKDGFSASMLTSDMFDLYLKKKKLEENSEAATALKNLDRILVVSQSGYTGPGFVDKKFDENEYEKQKEANKKERDVMYGEIVNHYKNGGYTLLKTEKRMGEDVKVYLKKNNEKVNSLVLITNSTAATNLVELDGDIDLANVASLNTALNLRGLENLYKIDNKSPYQYIGADAAQYFDQERLQVLEERARAMAERQAVLSEDQIKRFQEQAERQAQRQVEAAERYREMAERYRVQPIFLNYPGDSTDYFLNGEKATIEEIKELDKDDIKSIEVNKPTKDEDRTVVRIKTK